MEKIANMAEPPSHIEIKIGGNETIVASRSIEQQRAPLWAWLVATMVGIGHLRPGPGTWASAVTVLLWWGLGRFLPLAWQWPVAIVAAVAAVAVGIPASTRVAHADGNPDPTRVVIDEFAGQMITIVAAPLHWKTLLAGFILFRAFDILKPPPLRSLERLRPAGRGIVMDDVGAGLYALLSLQILIQYAVLS